MVKKRRGKVETRILPRLKMHTVVRFKDGADATATPILANILDISGSGILFISKRDFPKNAILEVEINFPGIEKPIKVSAAVVRTIRRPQGDYKIGAHYTKIDEVERQMLIKRINFIIKKVSESKSIWHRIKRRFIKPG